MPQNVSENEQEFHRKTARQCFNETWNSLEKKDRTPVDDVQMLLLAHTSRYHWGLVGTPRNCMVGEWQISRVYGALKQAELSILFAKSALDTCSKNSLSDMLVSAYEGMARAYVVAKDFQQARHYIERARDELKSVTDEDDKRVYAEQIGETEALIEE
jgi:hypothetical protein